MRRCAKMVFDAKTVSMLVKETWRTLYMVGLSSLISYLIGIPLGVALVVTDKDGIRPVPLFNKVAGVIVNLLRSVPFIILLAMVMPLTRAIVGKTIGANAAVVPLVIAAFPYISRMVEASLKEIDAGVIEAAKSMGASTWQIIFKVLLPESKPSLLVGAAISITTILGYSAMAGFIGGGGLGTGRCGDPIWIPPLSGRYDAGYRCDSGYYRTADSGDLYAEFEKK